MTSEGLFFRVTLETKNEKESTSTNTKGFYMKTEIVIEGDANSWTESLSIIFVLGVNLCAILVWLAFIVMCFCMGSTSQGFLFLFIGIIASWLLKKLCIADDN